ncbi:hypothetical protein SAMN06265348_102311 [Pedobacter westerhofensis]|uniref:Uncharacterized protein n=1 Tax=Pedobacter westerhofensis TaxID=425512 RepID=A0A521BI34_9SPHI|nr:hypothetical protein [Pedobacter westerhofensis]SMO46752.1 hypothetical protein SAMN06265348_102311 [Pedobacter westerhofensis]
MMKILRKNLFKTAFGIILLSIMLLKVCALSVSHLKSCSDPFAVEKNAEEGKDTKEEAFDKNEKKMLSCEFIYLDQGHLLWISHLPLSRYSYIMQIGSHPVKSVPTPPPDLFV